MTIKTGDFGEIEIDLKDVVTFINPIFGFEGYREFVFLHHQEINPCFIWMQSVQEPMLCFVLTNPWDVVSDYRVTLTENDIKTLGEGEYLYWALTVFRDPYYDSTINLKCPVVVNTKTGKALQAIVEEAYSIKHPLISQKEDA